LPAGVGPGMRAELYGLPSLSVPSEFCSSVEN